MSRKCICYRQLPPCLPNLWSISHFSCVIVEMFWTVTCQQPFDMFYFQSLCFHCVLLLLHFFFLTSLLRFSAQGQLLCSTVSISLHSASSLWWAYIFPFTIVIVHFYLFLFNSWHLCRKLEIEVEEELAKAWQWPVKGEMRKSQVKALVVALCGLRSCKNRACSVSSPEAYQIRA